jgi:hypothetical protein
VGSRRTGKTEKLASEFGESKASSGAGHRTTHEKHYNTANVEQGGAESGAHATEATLLTPDLAALVAAWTRLPEPIKAAIRALVASASDPS